MSLQVKDHDALAAAKRSDVNGLKRLPERPLLQQIRRSRTHIEMTGVRFGNQVVRGDFAVELRGFEPLTSAIRRGEWAAAFKD